MRVNVFEEKHAFERVVRARSRSLRQWQDDRSSSWRLCCVALGSQQSVPNPISRLWSLAAALTHVKGGIGEDARMEEANGNMGSTVSTGKQTDGQAHVNCQNHLSYAMVVACATLLLLGDGVS